MNSSTLSYFLFAGSNKKYKYLVVTAKPYKRQKIYGDGRRRRLVKVQHLLQ